VLQLIADREDISILESPVSGVRHWGMWCLLTLEVDRASIISAILFIVSDNIKYFINLKYADKDVSC